VEVKARSSFRLGFPEEAVTDRKKAFLKTAAEAYMEAQQSVQLIRFDIISILLEPGKVTIRHFEDAFY
jgi:putative endonuclease